MTERDRQILQIFAARVRHQFPDARIWAFGSRARGNATWESDFDICIVLDQVDHQVYRLIRQIAWEVGFENERVITTVVYSEEEFESGPRSVSTLTQVILREGVIA